MNIPLRKEKDVRCKIPTSLKEVTEEHAHRCAVYDPANQKWMKKSEHMPVWPRKMVFCPAYLLSLIRVVKSEAKLCTATEE
jgi:hypothetical protein